MQNQLALKVFLLRGLLLGAIFGFFGFLLRGYAYGAAILLAQALFQAVNLFVFPQFEKNNIIHLAYGAIMLVGILAFVGLFYLLLQFGTINIL